MENLESAYIARYIDIIILGPEGLWSSEAFFIFYFLINQLERLFCIETILSGLWGIKLNGTTVYGTKTGMTIVYEIFEKLNQCSGKNYVAMKKIMYAHF